MQKQSAETTNSSKQSSNANGGGPTKTAMIIRLLRRQKGASIAELIEATDWQAHSVRGFLSGTVKTKLGHELSRKAGKDGVHRYRITVQ